MLNESGLESDKIFKAAQVLKLNERSTISEIKNSYHSLIKKWHPDKCKQVNDKCKTKTDEIVKAYKIIINYCQNYRYSFKKEEIINNLPDEKRIHENLIKRFSNDPLWGNFNNLNKEE